MESFKYLVRELKIYEGGVEQRLLLQYVESDGVSVNFRPFDFERPGFAYLPTLRLEKDSEGRMMKI